MIKASPQQLGCLLWLLIILKTVNGQSTVAPRHDTQEWNDVQVSVALSKQIDFLLLGTLRIGRNVSHPVDERIGSGFALRVGKYLTITPSYLHITTQPTKFVHVYENRLSFAGTFRLPLKHFILTDRNLFERRLRHPGGDSTRYRNRLQIERPLKIGATKINFFASDEAFYDWSFNAWVRNRFAIGIGKTFNKHFTQEVYYLRQNDGHSSPGDLNVIGSTFRFRL
jgi:hypothetical protein